MKLEFISLIVHSFTKNMLLKDSEISHVAESVWITCFAPRNHARKQMEMGDYYLQPRQPPQPPATLQGDLVGPLLNSIPAQGALSVKPSGLI